MTDYPIVPDLLNKAWPSEFSGAWANIFISKLNNLVFALYFNDIYNAGYIKYDDSYLELPDAYISIKRNGEIYEIYVLPPFRRQGIGAMLCAWTRTNFINKGLIVKPPEFMTDAANALYNYLSVVYNEPYEKPRGVPIFNIYLDFGGWAAADIEAQYK